MKPFGSPATPPEKDTAGRFVAGHASSHGPGFRTPENAQRICELLISGKTLAQVAEQIDGCGGRSTILMWVAQDAEFEALYRRAKTAQADAMAEEIIDISDDASEDWEKKVGRLGTEYEVINKEAVMRSRLRVDTRLRLMAAYAPKRYGNKVEIEHDVSEAFAERLARARQRVAALDAPLVVIENEAAE